VAKGRVGKIESDHTGTFTSTFAVTGIIAATDAERKDITIWLEALVKEGALGLTGYGVGVTSVSAESMKFDYDD